MELEEDRLWRRLDLGVVIDLLGHLLGRYDWVFVLDEMRAPGIGRGQDDIPIGILVCLTASTLCLFTFWIRDATFNLEGDAVGARDTKTGSIASDLGGGLGVHL